MSGTGTQPLQSASQAIITSIQNILTTLTPQQQDDLVDDANKIQQGVNALAAVTSAADDEAAKILLKQNAFR